MQDKQHDSEGLEAQREFRITRMQPGTEIEANFPEIAARIAEITDLYAGTVVTLDYLPQAKKDRAYLNGLVKSVDQRRIEAKKAYMAPYEAFESQVKALLAPVREVSAELDAQIKRLEEEQKVEKRMRLASYYGDVAGALAEAVPFERIEDPAWLNKSFRLEDGYAAIDAVIERVFNDEKTLDSLDLSHKREAKAEFFATLDLSRAIARSKELDEQEEAARRLEESKAANMAALEAKTEQATQPEPWQYGGASSWKVDLEPGKKPKDEPRERWSIEVTCTRAELALIVDNIKSLGLTGKVVRR